MEPITTSVETAGAAFVALGMSDMEQCEHCGRSDLKRTILVGVTDADGNVISTLHCGTTCASRLTGRDMAIEAAQSERNAQIARRAVEDWAADIAARWTGSEIGLRARLRGMAQQRVDVLSGAAAPSYPYFLAEFLRAVAYPLDRGLPRA